MTIRFVVAGRGGADAAPQGARPRRTAPAHRDRATSICPPAAARTSRAPVTIGIIAVTGTESSGAVRVWRSCAAAARCARLRAVSRRGGGGRPVAVGAAARAAGGDGADTGREQEARKTVARLQSELAVHEAARLLAASPAIDGVRRGAGAGWLGHDGDQGNRFGDGCSGDPSPLSSWGPPRQSLSSWRDRQESRSMRMPSCRSS